MGAAAKDMAAVFAVAVVCDAEIDAKGTRSLYNWVKSPLYLRPPGPGRSVLALILQRENLSRLANTDESGRRPVEANKRECVANAVCKSRERSTLRDRKTISSDTSW